MFQPTEFRLDRADLVFEHGITNAKNELYTTIYKNRPEEFSLKDSKILEAVLQSQNSQDWAEVKGD